MVNKMTRGFRWILCKFGEGNSAATDGSTRGSIDQTTGTTYTISASRIQWNTDSVGKEYL
jgi:hypothetical protein